MHVDEVTKSLGETAETLSRTADLAKSAVSPAIVNVGAAATRYNGRFTALGYGKRLNN